MSRPKFAKGGHIKPIRKYFDDGGIATNSTSPTINPTGQTNGANQTNAGGIANAIGAGNTFQAGNANIQSGTNQSQLANAYTGANNAINAQIGLANTLTPQTQNAVANQNAVAAQELAMTQGQGPNPALAQLAQTTNQNVNNQAALMAGQRGAAGNVGEMARQAAQQGAATQQQAVGQAATQEANQQIAAQQNLAGLSANQVGQAGQAVSNLGTQQQNEQNILQGANTAYNNANVGMQSNINNVNSQTAQANQAANTNIIGSIADAAPGLANGIASLFKFEKGGEVGKDGDHLMLAEMNAHSLRHTKKYADGGNVSTNMGQPQFTPVQNSGAPQIQQASNNAQPLEQAANENFSNAIQSIGDKGQEMADNQKAEEDIANGGNGYYTGGQAMEGPNGHVAAYLAAGGKVPAMVSPNERYLNPSEVEKVKQGADPTKMGVIFKGKAKVKGDSLKNDTIPTTLDDGGVVIDRENRGSPNKERKFVMKSVAKHMKKPKKD